jgi:hypothetical protein
MRAVPSTQFELPLGSCSCRSRWSLPEHARKVRQIRHAQRVLSIALCRAEQVRVAGGIKYSGLIAVFGAAPVIPPALVELPVPARRFSIMGCVVAARGVEPRRLSAQDPKSCVSANFTKRPERGEFNQPVSCSREPTTLIFGCRAPRRHLCSHRSNGCLFHRHISWSRWIHWLRYRFIRPRLQVFS